MILSIKLRRLLLLLLLPSDSDSDSGSDSDSDSLTLILIMLRRTARTLRSASAPPLVFFVFAILISSPFLLACRLEASYVRRAAYGVRVRTSHKYSTVQYSTVQCCRAVSYVLSSGLEHCIRIRTRTRTRTRIRIRIRLRGSLESHVPMTMPMTMSMCHLCVHAIGNR